MGEGPGPAHAAVERVARESYGRLVARLAVRTRDIAGAEDALAEAFAVALSGWPRAGVPASPEAWIAAVAQRRLIDAGRRRSTIAAAAGDLRRAAEEIEAEAAQERGVPDRRLALLFACAHPAVEPAMRAPLMLQSVLGLKAAEIAGAFLVSPAAMGQRLVRAKARIREARATFDIPGPDELAGRLDAVLDAIYAAFGEGWASPAGTDVRRRALAEEAIWLARVVADLLPGEPEATGLLSLMLHLEARRGARRDEVGAFVPLDDQDVSLWDAAMIVEADALLWRASAAHRIGRYQLEAAIQSAHAVRRFGGRPDATALETLYRGLLDLTGSAVVAVNRAMVVADMQGPAAGLAALDAVRDAPPLAAYQPYWAARAELLARAGDVEAAGQAYDRAVALESDPAVIRFLENRRARLGS